MIEKEKLVNRQPNIDPFLFIGKIEALEVEKKIHTSWTLDPDYWFFKCHWPNNPNVPGAIMIEATVQTGSLIFFSSEKIKSKYFYITKISNAYFRSKIVPGAKVEIFVEVIKFKRGIADFKGFIKDKEKIVFGLEFQLYIEEFNQEKN